MQVGFEKRMGGEGDVVGCAGEAPFPRNGSIKLGNVANVANSELLVLHCAAHKIFPDVFLQRAERRGEGAAK